MSKLSTTTATTSALMEFTRSLAEALSFARLIEIANAHMAQRVTRRVLEELSDDQLRDIGLTRGMLEDAIRRPSRRYHTDY